MRHQQILRKSGSRSGRAAGRPETHRRRPWWSVPRRGSHRCRDRPPGGACASSGAACRRASRAATPEHLQPCAVDHHVDVRLLQGRRDTQVNAAAGKRGMVAALALTGSGTDNSRPSRSMIDPSMPSVWRHGRPNASLSINPASIATFEYRLGRPLRPVAAGTQAAIASGVTRPSSCHAAAVPRHTRPNSRFCTGPSGSCDDAVHSPYTASGPSVSAGHLYTYPPAAATAPWLFLYQGLFRVLRTGMISNRTTSKRNPRRQPTQGRRMFLTASPVCLIWDGGRCGLETRAP
jgi:hypothetical protein